MITNISFDLWLTLIRSHPLFKKRRAELLADIYNSKGLSVAQIENLIRERDKVFDRYNEFTGKKIPAKYMYLDILKKANNLPDNITLQQAEDFENQANELFVEYCPILLNDNIHNILESLYTDGLTLNLASNTGFVEGYTLRIVLEKLEILRYLSFCIFSDEVNASKPSGTFFQRICEETDVPKRQILHIGDNPKTDYEGAVAFGFSALLITKNNYTLNDIKAKLQSEYHSLLRV